MRLLICGTRNWPGTWEDVAVHLPDDGNGVSVVIHGACSNVVGGVQVSVDMIADFIARGLGVSVERYPVTHALDGPWPSAGPRRNARMLRDGKPDRGIAYGPLYKRAAQRGTPGDPLACTRAQGHKGRCGEASGGLWKPTGTGGMVRIMLRAGLPVRWISEPGAESVELTKMPEMP